MSKLEEKLQNTKLKFQDGLKKHVFDWVAAMIILALIAASLDVFGLLDLRSIDAIEFLISWFPYFAAAILLNVDLYKKGVFVGKGTENFRNVVTEYSSFANSLSGKEIENLYPFCEKYNEDAKRAIQIRLLRKEGISFEKFDNDWDETIDNKVITHTALKTRTKRQLLDANYTKAQINAIFKAKLVKVKGIHVNILLSTIDVDDITYLGNDETSMERKQMLFSTMKYMICTLLFSIIAIKDISDWGWVGLLLVLFKVVYLFVNCCISYFTAYDNITIHLVNHFTRKTDILKMYLKYEPEVEVISEPEFVQVGLHAILKQ